MVEETIKAIRETEREAEELLKAAGEQCGAILDEAQAQAKNLKEETKVQAQEKAKAALDMEKKIGEDSIQAALAEVESEAKTLKEGAKAKEGDVIAAVIAELV